MTVRVAGEKHTTVADDGYDPLGSGQYTPLNSLSDRTETQTTAALHIVTIDRELQEFLPLFALVRMAVTAGCCWRTK